MTNAEIIEGLRKIKNILGVGDSSNSVINGAINALERKEGTWIDDGFCPDCGARMEAKDED